MCWRFLQWNEKLASTYLFQQVLTYYSHFTCPIGFVMYLTNDVTFILHEHTVISGLFTVIKISFTLHLT